ncbi:MAG: hypothetical protein ACKVQC_05430 [Elusimicrobiota bacterium]
MFFRKKKYQKLALLCSAYKKSLVEENDEAYSSFQDLLRSSADCLFVQELRSFLKESRLFLATPNKVIYQSFVYFEQMFLLFDENENHVDAHISRQFHDIEINCLNLIDQSLKSQPVLTQPVLALAEREILFSLKRVLDSVVKMFQSVELGNKSLSS